MGGSICSYLLSPAVMSIFGRLFHGLGRGTAPGLGGKKGGPGRFMRELFPALAARGFRALTH